MTTMFEEQVRPILKARREVRRVPFPGKPDLIIGIRILSEREAERARLDAAKRVKHEAADLQTDPEYFDRCKMIELLWLACLDLSQPPDESGHLLPLFASPNDLREADTVTVEALLQTYLEVVDATSPLRAAEEGEVERIVEHLASIGEDQIEPLTAFDNPTLRRMLRAACAVIRKLRAPSATGSAGGQ